MRLYDSWRLRFRDDVLELDYRNHYWQQWLPYARIGMLSAAFLGAIFSLLDHLVVGYALKSLSLIRFGVLVPVIVIGFLLSFNEKFSQKYHWVVTSCLIVVGFCIISMISIIDPPASDYYYAGLIMVLFFNYTLLQLRLWHAILAGLSLVVSYELLTIFIIHTPSETIINNTFFMVSTTYGGVFACYTIERSRRQNFEQFKTIERDRRNLQEMAQRLEDISQKDELTGLYNRRRLPASMRCAIEGFAATGDTSALMLIDIDNFKEINDQYGHDAGDDVLVDVAAAIRECLPDRGVGFRYGGDEFLAVIPGSSAADSEIVARRILTAIYNRDASRGIVLQTRITVSIGITEVASARDSLRTVMQAADSALYEAKKSGKGRIVIQTRLDSRDGVSVSGC